MLKNEELVFDYENESFRATDKAGDIDCMYDNPEHRNSLKEQCEELFNELKDDLKDYEDLEFVSIDDLGETINVFIAKNYEKNQKVFEIENLFKQYEDSIYELMN